MDSHNRPFFNGRSNASPYLSNRTSHLGYPAYFGNALVVFKVLGALSLGIPQVPKRLKEFAYAGFTFNFLFESISHFAVDGIGFQSFFPLIFLVILWISYTYYNKVYSPKN